MYKISYFMTVCMSFSLVGQLKIVTPQGQQLRLKKEVFKQCQTLLNLIQSATSTSEPIMLNYSNKVPTSFVEQLFKGKGLNNQSIANGCYLLHLGLYLENKEWTRHAQQRLLSYVRKNNNNRAINGAYIEQLFGRLNDTLSLELFKKNYINNNNKCYGNYLSQQCIDLKERWICVGTIYIDSEYCYVCIDSKNNNLFVVSSNKILLLETSCSNAYLNNTHTFVATTHGALLKIYDCIKNEERLLHSNYLDDINLASNAISGWDSYTLHYWHLPSFEKQSVCFDALLNENIDDLLCCVCVNPNNCLFIFSSDINKTHNNRLVRVLNKSLKESIALLPLKITHYSVVSSDSHIILQYEDGTLQVLDMQQKTHEIIHRIARRIKHFSISDDGFYWLMSFDLKNNNSPLLMLYITQTQTKQYIPIGTVDEILSAEFNKENQIHILTKKGSLHKDFMISITYIDIILNLPLKELLTK